MAIRMLFPGADDELQLFEVRGEPNLTVESHAHTEDEVIYVLEGELRFGRNVCTAGSSVFGLETSGK